MTNLSRRRFFGSVAAAAAAVSSPTILTNRAQAGVPSLAPRKLPYPPNDNLGNYEPTITADGNTIYFARFAHNGDTRVKGPTDIFVTHRIRQNGEWPGAADDWSPAERLPDTVNSDSADQEPWITPDGATLYFMSFRKAPGVGPTGIWVSHKQPDGEWSQAQPVPGGNINTSEYRTHCFMPFDLPGEPSAMCFVSIRPR
ncbi:MAG: PD40 domain-containing protein [Hyphomicrobiales bacterium]|nr:PD40 domain-containing protein [Hyphomicrobiales bacterium]